MKTLVVEDDISMRRLLETMLCSRGHEVIACSNAEAAWDAYQREVYSLVILSVDDLQLCRQMRGAPYGDQSVIVFLTVSRQPEELQMLLEAGADDYLIKPIEAEFLNVRLAIIEQQASKRIGHKRVKAALRESTASARWLLFMSNCTNLKILLRLTLLNISMIWCIVCSKLTKCL